MTFIIDWFFVIMINMKTFITINHVHVEVESCNII